MPWIIQNDCKGTTFFRTFVPNCKLFKIKKRFFLFFFEVLMTVPVLLQCLIKHPWQGKRVAYFGVSITDPRNSGLKV